jgi:hypothetical protein
MCNKLSFNKFSLSCDTIAPSCMHAQSSVMTTWKELANLSQLEDTMKYKEDSINTKK